MQPAHGLGTQAAWGKVQAAGNSGGVGGGLLAGHSDGHRRQASGDWEVRRRTSNRCLVDGSRSGPTQDPRRWLYPRQRVRRLGDHFGTQAHPCARRCPAMAGSRDEPGRNCRWDKTERARSRLESQLPVSLAADQQSDFLFRPALGLRARDPGRDRARAEDPAVGLDLVPPGDGPR